jgi:proteasome lid subunit RPN8/RPN11
MNHPDEMTLILKGKSKKGSLLVEGLVIPPFSETGPTFAGFPSSFLPLDLSYIGMAHSHPEGTAEPSLDDLNNFFGLVSIIVKSPYNEEDIFAWDSSGNPITLSVSE